MCLPTVLHLYVSLIYLFSFSFSFFFFNDTATTEIYTLSLHDALPILLEAHHSTVEPRADRRRQGKVPAGRARSALRSEEHTSELQSHSDLVCRLLLEKKKKKKIREKSQEDITTTTVITCIQQRTRLAR